MSKARWTVLLAVVVLAGRPLAGCEASSAAPVDKGNRVRRVMESESLLPAVATNVVREYSASDLDVIFRADYRLGVSDSLVTRQGKFAAQYMEWDKGTHSEQIRLVFIKGEHGLPDALEGLFEIMGSGTTMAITPSTFVVLTQGPGDISYIMPASRQGDDANPKILHKMWFVRDNIGVELSCSGETDLLPIAQIIDHSIRSSPQKEPDSKAGNGVTP